MKKIKHLDLFSGIGGAALALDWVFGKGNIEHIFCDNDKFCQQVLKKHWPNSKIYGDIRTVTNTRSKQPRRLSSSEREPISSNRESGVYILTGGFPCQPFSQSSPRRKGTEDDRYLWPEMLRVIREFKPRWVVGENVAGLITWNGGMVLRQVLSDLENEGYEVQAFVVPACAVNAPHKRDRVWIVAHRASERPDKRSGRRSENGGQVLGCKSPETEIARPDSTLHDANPERERYSGEINKTRQSARYSGGTQWRKHWFEVATELCSVDDGLPVELDGFKLSKARHRAEQLKAYGNAWVPQVAVEIFKAIKKVESVQLRLT